MLLNTKCLCNMAKQKTTAWETFVLWCCLSLSPCGCSKITDLGHLQWQRTDILTSLPDPGLWKDNLKLFSLWHINFLKAMVVNFWLSVIPYRLKIEYLSFLKALFESLNMNAISFLTVPMPPIKIIYHQKLFFKAEAQHIFQLPCDNTAKFGNICIFSLLIAVLVWS